MNADAGLLDFVYVGVLLGSAVLLAILWRMLPGLLSEEITKVDAATDAPPLSAHESSILVDLALPRP